MLFERLLLPGARLLVERVLAQLRDKFETMDNDVDRYFELLHWKARCRKVEAPAPG